MTTDADHLQAAIAEARAGRAEGGIPIGAALVVDGGVIAVGHNKRVQEGSPIKHGETDCLENAGRLPASVYARATMVTTLSPCDMCTGAILLYGIPRVVVGENATFYGGEDYLRSRGVDAIWGGYHWLDRAPKGRNDEPYWHRRRYELEAAAA